MAYATFKITYKNDENKTEIGYYYNKTKLDAINALLVQAYLAGETVYEILEVEKLGKVTKGEKSDQE